MQAAVTQQDPQQSCPFGDPGLLSRWQSTAGRRVSLWNWLSRPSAFHSPSPGLVSCLSHQRSRTCHETEPRTSGSAHKVVTSGGCRTSLNPPPKEKVCDKLSKLVSASPNSQGPIACGRMNSSEGSKKLSWVEPDRQSLKTPGQKGGRKT